MYGCQKTKQSKQANKPITLVTWTFWNVLCIVVQMRECFIVEIYFSNSCKNCILQERPIACSFSLSSFSFSSLHPLTSGWTDCSPGHFLSHPPVSSFLFSQSISDQSPHRSHFRKKGLIWDHSLMAQSAMVGKAWVTAGSLPSSLPHTLVEQEEETKEGPTRNFKPYTQWPTSFNEAAPPGDSWTF